MKESLSEWLTLLLPWVLTHGLTIIFILVGTFIAVKVSKKLIEKGVRIAVVTDRLQNKVAERKREDTLIRIFSWTITILLWIVCGLMILEEVGVPIAPLLAGAGIIGLAVGFGGQYLIRDLITGFFIILENQYRIGDVVNLAGISGLVEDISLRMTILRDLDGTVHHIPHGEVTTVSNLSKYFSRVNLNIGVSYNCDLEQVIAVVNKTGQDLADDPQWKEFIIKAPQFLRLDEFADSSINIKILGDTLPLKQWDVAGELRKRIKIAFDKAGIEIPFPQRVVHHMPLQETTK